MDSKLINKSTKNEKKKHTENPNNIHISYHLPKPLSLTLPGTFPQSLLTYQNSFIFGWEFELEISGGGQNGFDSSHPIIVMILK